MTNTYRWVQWNRHKRTYDAILIALILAYIAIFVTLGTVLFPPPNDISPPILLIRALGTLAIILLTFILCIGPLARMTDLFAPFLYNRRHLGVAVFLIALAHGTLATLFYGGFGSKNPIAAILADKGGFNSISAFPFEILGLAALLILFAMAATSHDFWLANLGTRTWKTLHMLVYLAYTLVAAHVALGALQSETNPIYAILLIVGVVTVSALQLIAGLREWKRDRTGDPVSQTADGWIDIAAVTDLEEGQGKVISPPGTERIALFLHEGSFRAVSSVCAHQGGPIGEGQIVSGCITCPWHGYQYRPEDGQSPPPYTEKLPTYAVRVVGERVQINPAPNPPGTPTAAAPRSGESPDA